jgi:hypothetical protein
MRELSGQQAESFGAYTRQVAETMAPYEQQMDQYRTTLLPEYEKQRQSYQQSLEAFQAQLEEIKKNPTVTKTEQVEMPRGGLAGVFGRSRRNTKNLGKCRPSSRLRLLRLRYLKPRRSESSRQQGSSRSASNCSLICSASWVSGAVPRSPQFSADRVAV